MAFPLEPMPTVRQFVEAAVKEGLSEHYRELTSSRGTICGRHLVTPDQKIYYPLPIDPNERLAPETMASIARVTKTRAYIHLYQHLL